MMLSNVIVDVTIPRRSFVFGQSRAKVSAGFTNVRSLAVAAFDLVHCSNQCKSRPMSGNPGSRFLKIFAGGIQIPGFGIRNPTNDWNLESRFH